MLPMWLVTLLNWLGQYVPLLSIAAAVGLVGLAALDGLRLQERQTREAQRWQDGLVLACVALMVGWHEERLRQACSVAVCVDDEREALEALACVALLDRRARQARLDYAAEHDYVAARPEWLADRYRPPHNLLEG